MRGKQCSDFLAFGRAKLESGLERGLDATVTRTLMGSAYPQPGLYRKFYDLDMDPLVEVVRDTVGRHDTFALACQAKYYEDMGYPGHVNCTDNFNGALRAFEIAPRKGWEALNFFYNTTFDSNMQLAFDEPWSRPGDYVMLRAATDLVCASSACPDDIDPSNAWEVTDVHVRVYSPENRFSMAVARRVTADAEAVLTRETAFHPRTSELTKSFVEYRGYWLPHCFNNEGGIAEYWACREKLAVMDLSPLRKWEVLGPDAETLMQHVVTRNIRKLAVGQVVYTALCNETGGMIDDATVFRLGQDNFRFVGGDEYDGIWMRQVADRLGLKVWIKPTTDQLHNIAVQGPLSREALAEFVWTPPSQPSLEELKWFRFLVGRIGDYDGVPDRRLAHRLHRRARLRDLLPPLRRRGGVGRGVEGRRAARGSSRWASRRSTWCASSPGSSSPATSSTTRWTRSRPGSASRWRWTARTSSAATPCSSAASTRSAGWWGSSSTATRWSATATRSTWTAAASAWSPAACALRCCASRSRCAAWRSSTRRSGRRSRSASSTACRNGSPRPSYDSPSMTRRRNARGRD